jgi:hypothetical protein
MSGGAGSAGRRRNSISGQFIGRLVELLESPAYRATGFAARKALERIEIEHAHHGGNDNGKLPVTYADFERWDIHPNFIAPAIRELAALGLIEVTQRGYGGKEGDRKPSLYRLTYKPAWDATRHADGTHEWRRIKSREEAEALALEARKAVNPRVVELAKSKSSPSVSEGASPSVSEGEVKNPRPQLVRVQAHPQLVRVLSISPAGSAARSGDEATKLADAA